MVIKDATTMKEYVGVYTFHLLEEQTYFLIFDGENGELITRLKMPHRVPFGFHGIWVTGEELCGHHSYHGEEEDTVEADEGVAYLNL